MQKLLAYPLTLIYLLCFSLTLLIFHPIQWICFYWFGYKAHKKSTDYMNLCLMRCMHILGTRFKYINPHHFPKDSPLLVVANHQSMSDISPLSWFLRAQHPKFVSKIELGKGIPSVSFNLRHSGSVLINRKNPRQSLPALIKFGTYIENTKRTAVIFPEGSRSKDGNPKTFQRKGLELLIKKIPSGFVVPITINNSWETLKYGRFPMGLGSHITFTVHKPLKMDTFTNKEELMNTIESQIKEAITFTP